MKPSRQKPSPPATPVSVSLPLILVLFLTFVVSLCLLTFDKKYLIEALAGYLDVADAFYTLKKAFKDLF